MAVVQHFWNPETEQYEEIPSGGGPSEIPIATKETLGGVIVGEGLEVDDDGKIKVLIIKSHIGMIIQSTTLDTEDKVKAIYGGNSWSKIEGRMLIGASSDYAVNSTGGSATHSITTAEMPSHNHGLNAHTHSIPALSGTATTSGSHTHKASTNYVDNAWMGGATSNRYAFCNGGENSNTPKITATASGGSHTHPVTTTASTTGGNSGNTANSGSGTAMNIMNPYKAVYIWERTA